MIYETQPHLDIVTITDQTRDIPQEKNIISFFKSFDLQIYTDTTKYIIDYDIEDLIEASSSNPDDSDLVITTIGYSETMIITNKLTNTPIFYISFYYLPKSSIIRGALINNRFIN
jgi:hypothetical protein